MPATVEAIRQLHDAKADSDLWAGMTLRQLPPSGDGDSSPVWLEARLEVRAGRRTFRLVAEAHIGDVSEGQEGRLGTFADQRGAWVRERTEVADIAAAAGAAWVVERRIPDGHGTARVAPLHRPEAGWHGPGALTDLIGEDRCRHENARWVAAGQEPFIEDTARLECPTCHRMRVAAAPLHRLPEDHPVRREALDGEYGPPAAPQNRRLTNEERYLMRERYHAALRDDTRPVESIEQLTARDGLIELDPTHYAIGVAHLPRADRDGRPRSVRDAMARR